MIAAHLWSMGQPITAAPQLRPPFCCLDLSARKSTNLSFVLRWGYTNNKSSFSPNKHRKNSTLHCCRCSNNSSASSALEWDWNRWNRHFSEIEQAESFASVLKVPSSFILLGSYFTLPNC